MSNFKGGTGKSTTVMNLGYGLANKKKRVLLIDIDPQHNLTQGIGIIEAEQTIYDSLIKGKNLLPIELNKYLSVVPSSVDLIKAEIELSGMFKREYILEGLISNVKDNFDFIIIDCPPSLGLLTVNGLMASDLFFVPVEPEMFALNGLNVFNQALDKIDIDIDNILITKFDSRTNLHNDVVDAIERFMPGKTFSTKIRRNIKVAEAITENKDVYSFDNKCNGALDYNKLTNEVLRLHPKAI